MCGCGNISLEKKKRVWLNTRKKCFGARRTRHATLESRTISSPSRRKSGSTRTLSMTRRSSIRNHLNFYRFPPFKKKKKKENDFTFFPFEMFEIFKWPAHTSFKEESRYRNEGGDSRGWARNNYKNETHQLKIEGESSNTDNPKHISSSKNKTKPNFFFPWRERKDPPSRNSRR